MNQQTTTQPRREFRPVEQLTGGEHVNHQDDQDDDVRTWRVGHVAPYTDDNSVPMVALMLTPVGGGEPELIRERRGVTVPIATESEVASAEAEGNRFAVASALRQVADDIVNRRLPVPRYSFTVGGVLDSRGALEMWAEHLGVEIRMSGDIPVADKAAGGLTVHFQSAPEPQPVAEPEPTDDEIADEIDQAFAEPQTREIKARYLTAGMAVVSGRVREPLTVMSVLRDPDDSDFVRVVFRFVSGDTLYGVEDAVTVLADEQPATAEPQDGHVYSCCGKTGRISRHESWCETNRAEIPSQRTGE